jgi:hypothetical protein
MRAHFPKHFNPEIYNCFMSNFFKIAFTPKKSKASFLYHKKKLQIPISRTFQSLVRLSLLVAGLNARIVFQLLFSGLIKPLSSYCIRNTFSRRILLITSLKNINSLLDLTSEKYLKLIL